MVKRHGFILLLLLCVALLGALPFVAQAQTNFGTGWTADYFNNATLAGTPVLANVPIPTGVNFNFGTGTPPNVPGLGPDNFSIRFNSVQTFNAGTYEFTVASDDGVRVFINNALVFDRFVGRVLTTERFQQVFPAAASVPIRVEYFEGIDQAIVQFSWVQISGAVGTPGTPGVGGVVPTPFGTPFFTPTPLGPQGTVTNVRGLALRTGPYLGASYITAITPASTFIVLGRNRDEGIYSWYFLQLPDGRQGWASGRFLQINTDVNLIPASGSVFDQIDNAPDLGVAGYPRAVMNLRRRPSPRVERIASIPWGAPVSIVGRTVQGGQNRWLQVRYESQIGWIDARYVTIRGEINAVPVR